MKVVFDADAGAQLSLDDDERVRYVNYLERFWEGNGGTPVDAAGRFLHETAKLLRIDEAELDHVHQKVEFLDPMKQPDEFRLAAEKRFFDSTTGAFDQTPLNCPVWGSGLTVTLQEGPNRVVACASSARDGVDARLPDEAVVARYRQLFRRAADERATQHANGNGKRPATSKSAAFVRELVDMQRLRRSRVDARHDRLIRGRFHVYRYDEDAR